MTSTTELACLTALTWARLEELAGWYGDSFYVLDMQAFRDNYQELLGAFRGHYPNTNIGYPYKANYLPALCCYVQQAGGYAEVASWMEYELARSLAIPVERIIVNAPYQTYAQMKEALLGGAIVNLDAPYKVAMVEDVAHKYPTHAFAVGVRCNFSLTDDPLSRLGFDTEDASFMNVFERIAALPNCRVVGLHCHYSTGHRSIASYGERTARMIELVRQYLPDTPRYIDVGGGFFSKMPDALRAQFDDYIPSFDEYAAAIAGRVAAAYPAHEPELIIEPGSALVANIMLFVARVIDINQIRGRTLALASGSVHTIKPTMHRKNMPVQIVHNPHCQHALGNTVGYDATGVDIVGYTYMEHDVLHSGYRGEIARGDYAVFENVGGYSIVMKPPFIRAAPPILLYEADTDSFSLIRRQEEMYDVFATFIR